VRFLIINIILSLLIVQPEFSQPEYQFQHINSDLGLSSNSVTCILKDHIGYLWIGTYDGLNKYNGYDFKIYKHNPDDLSSIGANAIQTLFEDKQGNIWVGTFDGGLSKYDPLTEKFYTYLKILSQIQ
jgi:ligand-binding sensor domain-containing protein